MYKCTFVDHRYIHMPNTVFCSVPPWRRWHRVPRFTTHSVWCSVTATCCSIIAFKQLRSSVYWRDYSWNLDVPVNYPWILGVTQTKNLCGVALMRDCWRCLTWKLFCKVETRSTFGHTHQGWQRKPSLPVECCHLVGKKVQRDSACIALRMLFTAKWGKLQTTTTTTKKT